ncbi:MAG TPA: type II secretion system protein N [Albitalea sp.]|nr:type II secretion system protein N [Albitalea sp.]
MQARLSAFLIWALVAASAMFWGLRLFVTAPAAPPYTLAVTDSAPARVDLTRLFGAPPVVANPSAPAPSISSRFQLTGVMAPKTPGAAGGVALIAVDGKMPRAFHVGAALDGELVLQSVSLRTATIGPAQGAAVAVLELPPLPPPATGVLPPPGAMTPPVAGAVPQVVKPPTPVAPVAPPVAPAVVPAVPPATQAAPGGQAIVPPRHSRGLGATPRDMKERETTE